MYQPATLVDAEEHADTRRESSKASNVRWLRTPWAVWPCRLDGEPVRGRRPERERIPYNSAFRMEHPDLLKVLESSERLRVLSETELLDSEAEEVFDRLTRLAARLLEAPTAVVSLIDANRQFLKSSHGLGEVPGAERNTPLTHSFCKYTVATNQPLVVENAPEHPLVRDNLAVSELGVKAYAGVPIGASDQPLGALCVVDGKPRVWSADQVELLRDLA